MCQTGANTPAFSKSAPNLDKSRIGTSGMLANQPNTNLPSSSSRNNILGKSVEGLNTVNNSSNNSTAFVHRQNIGSVDGLNYGEKYSYDDDEDDEDDEEVKGCFGFIRSDDHYVKRKKHSLDSKMAEHNHNQTPNFGINYIRPPNNLANVIGSGAYAQNITDDDTNVSNVEIHVDRNLDNVLYDRVFYRTIQKSLEEIFARDDYNQQFVSQKSRNSKSSGDLTMYNDEDETYAQNYFPRYGSASKFDRECFFVKNNNNDSSDESDPNISIKSNTLSYHQNQEFSQKSTELPLDTSFGSLHLNGNSNGNVSNNRYNSHRSHDERTNSICSDDQSSIELSITPSVSRKSSVTFRVDTNGNTPISNSTNQLFYSNLESTQNSIGDMSTDLTTKFLLKTKQHHHTNYALIAHTKTPLHHTHKHTNNLVNANSGVSVGVLKSALSKKEKKDKPTITKSKYKTLTRFLKFPKKTSVLHSNSFYNKNEDKSEMNEQLLVEDKANNSTTSNEPQYDAIFRTKNFLLAKQNET